MPANESGPWLLIIIITVGVFSAICVCGLAYKLQKWIADKSNIKWKRKYMENKLKKIENAPKRSRRQTVKVQKNTDFTDLTQIPRAKGDEDKHKNDAARRQSMFVGHGVAGSTKNKGGAINLEPS